MGGESLNWNHFTFLLGIIAAWSLVIIATARWAISSGVRGIKEQIAGQDQKIAKIAEKQHQMDLDVANLRAELPLCYVRREDFIREEVTINTKLDRLRDIIARQNEEQGDDPGS